MANCDLCGEEAARRQRRHESCQSRRDAAIEGMSGLIERAARGETALDDLEGNVLTMGADSYVRPDEILALYVQGFDSSVAGILEDRIITGAEEQHLAEYLDVVSVPEWKVAASVDLVAFCRGLLRVMEDADPCWVDGAAMELPLEAGEKLLYMFYDARLVEHGLWPDRADSAPVSGSRTHDGLYVGMGDIRKREIAETEDRGVVGCLAVTSKRLRFDAPGRQVSIGHAEIARMWPGVNGLILERYDVGEGTESFFVSEGRWDGWRLYNLLLNLLNRRESELLRRREAGVGDGL